MIPFSPPRIDQKVLDEVNAALLSGWITTGPRTKLFEKKLRHIVVVRPPSQLIHGRWAWRFS